MKGGMKHRLLSAFVFTAALFGCSRAVELSAPVPAEATDSLVVVFVRHAEKAGPGDDAPLTEDGKARARLLARTLRSTSITRVHSSNYVRTLETAAPIAKTLETSVERYDARDLPTLIEKLRSVGGRHLVVGHSNTTPAAVRLLGGNPGSSIGSLEYDRLYIVTVSGDVKTTTVMLRYGEASD